MRVVLPATEIECLVTCVGGQRIKLKSTKGFIERVEMRTWRSGRPKAGRQIPLTSREWTLWKISLLGGTYTDVAGKKLTRAHH